MDLATVVIDNGTGYTKMGYAGNMEPSYIIPTAIAEKLKGGGSFSQSKLDKDFKNAELDFFIGEEAIMN